AAELGAKGLDVETHVAVSDHAAEVIVEWGRGCELVALATRGRGMSRLVLGSVADKVVRATETAILILRPAPVPAAPALLERPEVEEQLPAISGV
ncbi:MAG TPA: universal stress protein, partial [Gemmatimonadaceae bacterium]|nr:universal stress protein [Gemmatimonadaceae bacterium]